MQHRNAQTGGRIPRAQTSEVGSFFCPKENQLRLITEVAPLQGLFVRGPDDPKRRYQCLVCGCRQVRKVGPNDNMDDDVYDEDIAPLL